ncbi:unnamed protein product [Caenorhabditis auriculariae]|uniref:Protein farnesyltransferase/geranylgeranyltransferase type-1 subunit alpha n=1 Tax=Caenorhabditis auriculariae TaxID=2777116 RepID=A0A8S1HRC6_9PELO|nr:unnamed protein product [Caenorhabditis auriculariae]
MSMEGQVVNASVLYKDNELWKDVTPIYPNDAENGAVRINLSEQFVDAFAYLRAAMEKLEYSERTLDLTTDCIQQNPANYSVWQYRREILLHLKKNLGKELEYLDMIIEESPKNYQVWHHRRKCVEELGIGAASGEINFTALIIGDENKNYHAWQHRQWVVRTFKVPYNEEMSFSLRLLLEDHRNNSAYNYRYFLITLYDKNNDKETIDVEINLCKRFIEAMPNNESVWNYLSGLLLNNAFYTTEPDKRSPYLLSFIADAYLERIEKDSNAEASAERASQLYSELTDVDPVRANYWKYQRIHVTNVVERIQAKRN